MVASVESRGYGDYDAMNTPGANTPYNRSKARTRCVHYDIW